MSVLLRDLGADQIFATRWLAEAAKFKFESKFELAITPKGYSGRQWKVLTAKLKAELLGQCFGIARADLTGDNTGFSLMLFLAM